MPGSSSASAACQPVCLRGTQTAILSRLKCVTRVETRFSLSSLGCMLHPTRRQKKKKKSFSRTVRRAQEAWMFVYGNPICMCAPRLFLIFLQFLCPPGIFSRMSPHPTYAAFLKVLLPLCSTGSLFFRTSVRNNEKFGLFSVFSFFNYKFPFLGELDHILTVSLPLWITWSHGDMSEKWIISVTHIVVIAYQHVPLLFHEQQNMKCCMVVWGILLTDIKLNSSKVINKIHK